MVKLTWENKKQSKPVDLEKYHLNYFKQFEQHPTIVNNGLNDLQSSEKWVNKLFWGDNLDVLYYLLKNLKEKIDLIYIDPPFFSGVNYKIKIKEEDKVYDSIAYYDHWNKDLDSYLQMLYERIKIFKELLSNTGLIFIHSDWHANHYIQIILDEIFGKQRFVNSIVWYYYNKYSAGKKHLPRAHDNILVYSKSNKYTFNQIRLPREKPRKQLKRKMVNGVLKNVKGEDGHVIYRTVTDKKMDDVWRIPCLQPASKEWTGFPTQKHHKLLERIIKIASNEGDLIADFFCGSGTSLIVAEKLGRRWIGCDISEYSIYLAKNRILDFQKKTQKSNPFDLFAPFDEKQKEIIMSGFFQKEITIKHKK